MFTAIIQPKGLLHRFIRSKDTSTVVERPERLRAVAVGIAVAAARLEELLGPLTPPHALSPHDTNLKIESAEDVLTDALDRLAISSEPSASVSTRVAPFNILDASPVTLDLLTNPALEFVHGEATDYLSKVVSWAAESETRIKAGESEIPTGYSQGDLYLCPQSIEAIAGAASAMCEAVDMSMGRGSPALKHEVPRVFVAARPPGHHCSDEMPSGFCFVNNVMIGVAHAHLKYGVKRFVVLDFDLHHGNGTQAITWSINAETMRQREENDAKVAAGLPPSPTGPQVYYASLHDILSFPCEDGDAALVQAASTTLSGAHGQYIENVHLERYSSEDDFFSRLYPVYQERLIGGAARFLASTEQFSSSPEETMIFVSAGFDASPHEHEYMSRHNRNVPTAFYTRFAHDVVAFAEKHAMGRVVSVLEGGYSDWGLMSASAAYVSGMAAPEKAEEIVNRRWWEPDSLEQMTLRDRTKREPGGASGTTPGSSPSGRSQATTSAVNESSTQVAAAQSPPRKPRSSRTPASSPPKSKAATTSSRPPVSSVGTTSRSVTKPVSKAGQPRTVRQPAPPVPRLPVDAPESSGTPLMVPSSAPTTPVITPAAEILAAPPNSAPPKPIGRAPQEQEILKIRIKVPSRVKSPPLGQEGASATSEQLVANGPAAHSSFNANAPTPPS
ncbi:Arginase/deacetylase [Clavulina sp. PMI_390]|nr:Arginase/deacetylase [Clavulina sp. PMI_390]